MIIFLICNIKVFNIFSCISLFMLYNLNKSFEFNNEINLKKIFLLFKIKSKNIILVIIIFLSFIFIKINLKNVFN